MRGRLKTPRARECRICGKTFHATTYNQVCCSDECRAADRKAKHSIYWREWRERPGKRERQVLSQKAYMERLNAARRAVPRLRRAIYEINAIVSDAYSLGAPRDVSKKLCEAIKLAAKTLKTI